MYCEWDKGKDAFTCMSSRGSSVVDYCIVPYENLSMIFKFRVVTMPESIDEMKLRGVPLRVPDHSLLLWDSREMVMAGGCWSMGGFGE